MRCLVCGEIVERSQAWDHIRSQHLAPLGLTQAEILARAQKIAQPLEVKTAYITCLKLPEKVIYFSLENAELLIAFAHEQGGIIWTDVVAWQILHEKAHLECQSLYQAPAGAKPYILLNAEDYFINNFLIPEKYWPVCLANARCATRIRNFSPVPYELRDGYFYCTQATFLAYGAVTLADIQFLKPAEARFTEIVSNSFREIRGALDIPLVSLKIARTFDRLYPPPGKSWDRWEIPCQDEKRF